MLNRLIDWSVANRLLVVIGLLALMASATLTYTETEPGCISRCDQCAGIH